MRNKYIVLIIFTSVLSFGNIAFCEFIVKDDLIVIDTSTGLMWQRATAEEKMTWKQALDYCKEKLSLGDYKDWRLPTIKELVSIVDYSVYDPTIDTDAFPDTMPSHYWSSTPGAFMIIYAWHVYFRFGYVSSVNKLNSYFVRCVRGGQR